MRSIIACKVLRYKYHRAMMERLERVIYMAHHLAIIGYGGMGNWHAENIAAKMPEIKVIGVYDIRKEAMDKARKQGLHVYPTPEELLTDRKIDIVLIATPNNFHKDYALACLRAGKTTICEKPVTMNAAELEDIIATAEETKTLFSIHQNRRWDQDYCIIKRILDEKTIGEPYFIESRVQGSRRAMHGWRGYKVNGGGMVLDWGVHLLDQIMQLIDSPVVSVGAHLFSIFAPEVDDNIKIFLRFQNGVSAVMEMATNCFINLPLWHISCMDGTAVVEDWDCRGKIVRLNTDSTMEWEDDIIYTEAGPTRTMAPRPVHTTRELPLPEVHSDWSEYYRNIVDVLDNGAELLVTPSQALRVMRVIDIILASHENGHTMECNV